MASRRVWSLAVAASALAACFTPVTEAPLYVFDGGHPPRRDGGCTRHCAGHLCGDDGCGGQCGTCGGGAVCQAGTCVECPAGRACEATCCAEGTRCIDRVCTACGCGARMCGLDDCGNPCGTCVVPKVCSTSTWRCVDADVCADVHCPPGTVCDPADGACRCTATSCQAGQVCGSDGKCLDACSPACWGEQPWCDPSTRTCQCAATSCGASKYCNATTGRCESADCSPPCAGETPFCNQSRGQCTCTAASCIAGRTCDATTGRCVDSGGCSTACSGETPVCDLATRTCQCNATSCVAPRTCDLTSGTCVSPGCVPPCVDGQVCVAGLCVAAGGCDPAWQTGCPGGQGCYLDASSGSYGCLPAGTQAIGSPCQTGSECRAGAECQVRDGARVCLEYCDPLTEVGCSYTQACLAQDALVGFCGTCPAERSCNGYCCPFDSTCGADGMCTSSLAVCDPFAPNSCPAGQGCYQRDVSSGWGCEPAGPLAEGASCTKGEECLPGLACLYLDGERRCRKFCSAQAGTQCGVGQQCANLLGPDYGICVDCQGACGCCPPGQVCSSGACAFAPGCDPTKQGMCPAGTGCYYEYGLGSYVCAKLGTGQLNGPCFFDWECSPGMGCLGPHLNVCLPYCSDAQPACATGRDCVPMGDGFGWCG